MDNFRTMDAPFWAEMALSIHQITLQPQTSRQSGVRECRIQRFRALSIRVRFPWSDTAAEYWAPTRPDDWDHVIEQINRTDTAQDHGSKVPLIGGRYWIRTSDLCRVKTALSAQTV